jgi:hypothetical protein
VRKHEIFLLFARVTLIQDVEKTQLSQLHFTAAIHLSAFTPVCRAAGPQPKLRHVAARQPNYYQIAGQSLKKIITPSSRHGRDVERDVAQLFFL